MATLVPSRKPTDLLVVGGGVIGLTIAARAARSGLEVRLVDASLPGAASKVAAGLFAPSLGTLPQPAGAAFRRAAAEYQTFASWIGGESGREVVVGHGIIEVALPPDG